MAGPWLVKAGRALRQRGQVAPPREPVTACNFILEPAQTLSHTKNKRLALRLCFIAGKCLSR
ncbi:hypothetical protein DFAR_1450010 [Desulfarculales bacterium]